MELRWIGATEKPVTNGLSQMCHTDQTVLSVFHVFPELAIFLPPVLYPTRKETKLQELPFSESPALARVQAAACWAPTIPPLHSRCTRGRTYESVTSTHYMASTFGRSDRADFSKKTFCSRPRERVVPTTVRWRRFSGQPRPLFPEQSNSRIESRWQRRKPSAQHRIPIRKIFEQPAPSFRDTACRPAAAKATASLKERF